MPELRKRRLCPATRLLVVPSGRLRRAGRDTRLARNATAVRLRAEAIHDPGGPAASGLAEQPRALERVGQDLQAADLVVATEAPDVDDG